MIRLLERFPASPKKKQRPGKSIRQEAALKKGKTGRGILRQARWTRPPAINELGGQ
jgi:hypothetical protein